MIFLFIILVQLILISGFTGKCFNYFYSEGAWYIDLNEKFDIYMQFLTFFTLYNNFIPISLQVTLEIVRFFQASFINSVFFY